MTLIDRMLLKAFLKAWIVCFLSLVSLYLVIDMFGKIDDFLEIANGTLAGMVQVVASYYGVQIVMIFDRLCGIIILLAASFTVAWMQRNNELAPLLSAGVPTRRVIQPVILGSLLMLGVSLVNREVVMPRVSGRLQHPASDPHGEKMRTVNGAYEPNGILIAGQSAYNPERRVNGFTCTIPEKISGSLVHITAREARYIPPGPERYSGGWLLTETTPRELPTWKDAGGEPILEMIDPGKFFLRTEQVDYQAVTRNRNWHQFASTWAIYRELQSGGPAHLKSLSVQLHMRLTLPLLTMLMVLMGMSNLLRSPSRNLFVNAGLGVVLAGLFFAVIYLARHLGENGFLDPPLAAWLPVFLFGPITFAMFDAIQT